MRLSPEKKAAPAPRPSQGGLRLKKEKPPIYGHQKKRRHEAENPDAAYNPQKRVKTVRQAQPATQAPNDTAKQGVGDSHDAYFPAAVVHRSNIARSKSREIADKGKSQQASQPLTPTPAPVSFKTIFQNFPHLDRPKKQSLLRKWGQKVGNAMEDSAKTPGQLRTDAESKGQADSTTDWSGVGSLTAANEQYPEQYEAGRKGEVKSGKPAWPRMGAKSMREMVLGRLNFADSDGIEDAEDAAFAVSASLNKHIKKMQEARKKTRAGGFE
ncbi:hypothetical protein LTR85_005058 [Meristemomyces frigidus]|nr:hypothetical protein LTR85_005058 [Meristemomyces frigidus]